MSRSAPTPTVVEKLLQDVSHFLRLSEVELYDLEPADAEAIQLHHLRRIFPVMRSQIRALDRLAGEIGVNDIQDLNDVVPLCFPHTMYKSYSMKDLESGRYDRMTKWLQTVTAIDLSKLDLHGVDSLERWLTCIEAQTQLRPRTSSGTSGKISIFPFSLYEEDVPFFEMVMRTFDPYRDEPSLDFRSGNIPLIFPWPTDKGRHNLPVLFRMIRKLVYAGREDMLITLGKGVMTADEMLLAGKLRRAENRGEELVLSPQEKEIARNLAQRSKGMAARWQGFVEEAVIKQKGKTVVFYSPWFQMYELAKYCKDHGVRIEWAPDSIIVTGGGTKGNKFPEGWRELIDEMMPFKYPDRYKETYSFTESTANSILCSRNRLHPHPWGITFVVDPDSGKPLPRHGVQKGRSAAFDLLPKAFWGGTITGDEVTINWEGGCECGRKGPYFMNDIRRYIETRDGDDKITCAKTPDAYDKLAEFALGLAE